MKNHEKPKFNDCIKELQSQKEFISRRELIEYWRKSMLCGEIWYRDGNTEIQSIRGIQRGDSNNKRKRCRRKNIPNTVLQEERYDEHHEFDIIHISEFKNKIRQRKEEEYRWKNRPDGDRQLPSKKEAKLRKEYLQASDYKADELLLAS
jgi:hypothetical protein